MPARHYFFRQSFSLSLRAAAPPDAAELIIVTTLHTITLPLLFRAMLPRLFAFDATPSRLSSCRLMPPRLLTPCHATAACRQL